MIFDLPAAAQVPLTALDGVTAGDRVGQALPLDIVVVDPDGHRQTLAQAAGDQPFALVLAWYRCPMLCGLVGKGLGEVEGERLTVSFDPEDRPEDALRARTRDHADWPYLVVADPADLPRLEDALGFRAKRQPDGQWAHPAVVYVVTPDGRLAERIPGVRPDPDLVRASLDRADRGEITDGTSWIDACLRWNPASRAHGPQVLAFLRLGAVAIGGALVSVMFYGSVKR